MSEIEKTDTEQTTEERASLRQPPQWLTDALSGGLSSSSGVKINEDTALSITAVYAAVRVISETVSSLPLKVYKKTPEGREEYRDNNLWKLLHDTPNREMSSYTFREVLTGMALTHGNGFAEIVRDGSGRPVELWPMLPGYVTIEVVDNRIVYIFNGAAGSIYFEADQVFHIKNFSTDGIIGKSPIRLAREALGLSVAAERMGGERFANSSHPGGVLEHPGKLSPEGLENLRKSWEALHKGTGNSSRVAVLEEGMRFNNISIPSDDAQWIETRKFQISEIARMYRVPPHTIGDLERSTFSNIESQQISFYRDTLLPWLTRWEQEIQRKLIPDQDALYAEHNVDGIMRGDTEARYQSYKVARESGILSVNEIRMRENLNPIEGGDIYLQPLNMVSVSDEAYQTEENNEDRALLLPEGKAEGLGDHINSWLREACTRAFSIEANAGRRSVTKYLEKNLNPQKLVDSLTTSAKRFPERVVEITASIIESLNLDTEILNSAVRVEAASSSQETLRGAVKILRANDSNTMAASAELKNWYDETTEMAACDLADAIFESWSKNNGK